LRVGGLRGAAGRAAADRRQFQHGFPCDRVERRFAASCDMRDDRRARPRIPELRDVVGSGGNRLVLALVREELADWFAM
jgi:hypothetical protein